MPVDKSDTRLLLVLVLMLFAAAIAGCGTSGPSSQSAGTEVSANPPVKPFNGPAEITKFGAPGSSSDLQAASKVLAQNLEARENGDFARQCASLDALTKAEITGATNRGDQASECPTKLKALAEPLKRTAAVRKDTFDGSVDEIRVKGPKAWALYHGNDGKNYSIPLRLEEGSWKVGSIATTEIG